MTTSANRLTTTLVAAALACASALTAIVEAQTRTAPNASNITGAWEQAKDDEANIQWARDAWNAMKGFGTGGNYINFQTADESSERLTAALGHNLPRLAQIKARWDPDNVFQLNQNIPPAGRAD